MRDSYRIVDADGHVSEPHEIWRDYLDARYRAHLSYGEDGWVRVDGERVNRISGFRPQQPRTDHNRLQAAIERDFAELVDDDRGIRKRRGAQQMIE